MDGRRSRLLTVVRVYRVCTRCMKPSALFDKISMPSAEYGVTITICISPRPWLTSAVAFNSPTRLPLTPCILLAPPLPTVSWRESVSLGAK